MAYIYMHRLPTPGQCIVLRPSGLHLHPGLSCAALNVFMTQVYTAYYTSTLDAVQNPPCDCAPSHPGGGGQPEGHCPSATVSTISYVTQCYTAVHPRTREVEASRKDMADRMRRPLLSCGAGSSGMLGERWFSSRARSTIALPGCVWGVGELGFGSVWSRSRVFCARCKRGSMHGLGLGSNWVPVPVAELLSGWLLRDVGGQVVLVKRQPATLLRCLVRRGEGGRGRRGIS